MGGGPVIPDNLTPEQAEAIDELFHQCDLIATRPLPCEIAWALRKPYDGHMVLT